MGRPAALTKLGSKRIHRVRVRGGAIKQRALRLETGNFSWGTEAISRKSRILRVVYHPSSNEFVRTNTLVKSSIVEIDATPFRQWYEQHYGVQLVKKKKAAPSKDKEGEKEAAKQSRHVKAKIKSRQTTRTLETQIEDQFTSGRLFALISSRPGQVGRADGYVLEGQELQFYLRKLSKKKEKKDKSAA